MNCQKNWSSIQHWEKIICTSLEKSVFKLQQVLVVNKEFAMGGKGTVPLTDVTDMTIALAGDLSNLLMMYQLIEVLAIALGKTDRALVPQHKQIPGLGSPKFRVVLFNSFSFIFS